jgi:hypothetical protein
MKRAFTKQAEEVYKESSSAQKLLVIVFWNRKGVLTVGLMQQ